MIEKALACELLSYENTKEYPESGDLRLTAKGYTLHKKLFPPLVVQNKDAILLDDTYVRIEVGILEIHPETIIPSSGFHQHLVVLCNDAGNRYIGIGCLTSQKKDNLFLADYQVNSEGKAKYLRRFEVPILLKASDFKFEYRTTLYIRNESIDYKLKKQLKFSLKITPQAYNHMGITKEQLSKMIDYTEKKT